ncbi:hypothetical protein WJX72_007073 [[Myrmecia] bisecta]|uniref:Uncharacterized protein n=1 Tax=[Myrmecia] bisecta TaxID=41462 RepID=A0AAW1P4F0_9CHLO
MIAYLGAPLWGVAAKGFIQHLFLSAAKELVYPLMQIVVRVAEAGGGRRGSTLLPKCIMALSCADAATCAVFTLLLWREAQVICCTPEVPFVYKPTVIVHGLLLAVWGKGRLALAANRFRQYRRELRRIAQVAQGLGKEE